MEHDDDGETSYNTFVDDVAFEPTYLQALLTAAERNVATESFVWKLATTSASARGALGDWSSTFGTHCRLQCWKSRFWTEFAFTQTNSVILVT